MPSDPPEPEKAQSRSGRSGSTARKRDEALMARIAAGDARAFAEVVDTRLERVHAVARRMLGDPSDAEDVAQEALLRLWRQADAWDGNRALISTWLYRVTCNLCIDRIRARREDVSDDLPETPEAATQQQALEEEDLRRFMDSALSALPERQRLALVLFHYEELSMAEVAEIMEVSVEAVESLLARGRRTLKKKLAPAWQAMLPDDET